MGSLSWLLGGVRLEDAQILWTGSEVAIVAAAAIALLTIVLVFRGGGRRWAEWVLWTLAAIGLVIAAARPVAVTEAGRQEAGRVAVLVDASSSMSVLDGNKARSDAAIERLQGLGADVDVFHFGAGLNSGVPAEFTQGFTDLGGALADLNDQFAGEQLAGVVVITDGIDRGTLRSGWASGETPKLPELNGPLTVFQVGEAGQQRDLSVQWVDAGGFAYIHTDFHLKAGIRGVGYEGRQVDAEILRDGRLVQTQTVRLDDKGEAQVDVELRPQEAGRFTWTVRVPVWSDDAVPGNNSLPVAVRVVRDRIRVLQVAGAPSWDVKFLRRFLKGDPSVDLVSFFILRTQEDMSRRIPANELSLIQFPYEQLFTTDLFEFDLVIFQNFDAVPYFQRQTIPLLDNIRRFVEDGGHGFAMIGGDRSFSLGGYGGTPLASVLPVEVSADKTPADPTPFRPALTEAGARHPVTRLVRDPAENQQWWDRLVDLDGTNVVSRAKPDAAVLLTHPRAKTPSGEPIPVLAVREAGEGRAMSLTVDTSWRWSLSEAAEGRGNQAYLRFWKGALRWLAGDEGVQPVRVDPARENYSLGDEVRLVADVRDASFAPVAGAEVSFDISNAEKDQRVAAVTGEDGQAVVTLPAETRGAHRVHVEAKAGSLELGVADTTFAVTSRDPELDDIVPDAAFLQWLASSADGLYVAPGENAPILRDDTAGRTVWDRTEVELWRSPWLLGGILLCAGLAWILRRRAGLR